MAEVLKQLHIVLVEDNKTNQDRMTKLLEKLFSCEVTVLSNGIAAINYLLAPKSKYDLVILGAKSGYLPLMYRNNPIDGPYIASAMKEKGICTSIVLWTQDYKMLTRFDEIFGKRLPEMAKPMRDTNVSVILAPIVEAILQGKKSNFEATNENNSGFSPFITR